MKATSCTKSLVAYTRQRARLDSCESAKSNSKNGSQCGTGRGYHGLGTAEDYLGICMGAIPQQESAESLSLLSHLSYTKSSYLLAREAADQQCASVSGTSGRTRAGEAATHYVA